MILISHRGNVSGPIPEAENSPEYINDTIRLGYDVEVDVWVKDNMIYLGHDEPKYYVTKDWLVERFHKLWIHCKNIEAIEFFRNTAAHYFWHQEDTLTLTSNKYIWVYPGKQPVNKSIAVMPEINNDDITKCLGICSDYIQNYKQ